MSKNRDLGNYGSAALLDADVAPVANTVVKRTAEGKVKTANAVESDDAVAFGQLGSAAQRTVGTTAANIPDNAQLNVRLGTTGNLGNAAQRNVMNSLTDATTPDALMPRGAFGIGISERGNFTTASGIHYAPQDIRTLIGGADGHYTLSSDAGGIIDFGNTALVPERYGVIKGFCDSNNNYGYSWQIYTSVSGKQYRRRGLTATSWSAWSLIYDQSNVVGTVAQSGGIPTAAIIERGSNANGSYVRYADGTQICWFISVSAYGPVTSDNGLVYSTNITWNYPAQFIDPPTTFYTPGEIVGQSNPICWATGAGKLGGTVAGVASDSPIYMFFSQTGGFTYKIRGLAVGRWYN